MIPSSLNPLGINSWSFPLTLTALQANSTVSITKIGNPTVNGLQYRTNTSGWQSYAIDTTITLAQVGDYVQFQNSELILSVSSSSYVKFVLTGEIKASGNIQSMLNYRSATYAYCFLSLFSLNAALMTAPKLPAMSLANDCYRYMFGGCTSLTTAPELPATTLAPTCYYNMFNGCTSLVNAPELPAMTLANYCYSSMFYGCRGLVAAPHLPATTLAQDCYTSMFHNCVSLQSLSVAFTTWGAYFTTGWVHGVTGLGTFRKPAALAEEYGENRIPTGWTIINQ